MKQKEEITGTEVQEIKNKVVSLKHGVISRVFLIYTGMKQKFIKYLFSFQLGVNCIGLPIFYEVHAVTNAIQGKYGKERVTKQIQSNVI